MTERIVVFSGAGVSAESGIRTFRDGNGLWEEHRIEDVATPHAWRRDPGRVLRFYNERRSAVLHAVPNAAHMAIAELQRKFDVYVVTQNVDDLHERAGSKQVLHLHGEIGKARSTVDPQFITPINGPALELGDRCPMGSQLRPHIVWFGEEVPLLEPAAHLVAQADLLIVVGTSLQVYPAAGLIHATRANVPVHVVDPAELQLPRHMIHHRYTATEGMSTLCAALLAKADRN